MNVPDRTFRQLNQFPIFVPIFEVEFIARYILTRNHDNIMLSNLCVVQHPNGLMWYLTVLLNKFEWYTREARRSLYRCMNGEKEKERNPKVFNEGKRECKEKFQREIKEYCVLRILAFRSSFSIFSCQTFGSCFSRFSAQSTSVIVACV